MQSPGKFYLVYKPHDLATLNTSVVTEPHSLVMKSFPLELHSPRQRIGS